MLSIGAHALPDNLLLAPMAGVTDAAFRQLCLSLGAAYAASEMISADTALSDTPKTAHRIRPAESGIHAVQIAGSEPHQLAEAARFNVASGAQVIDINMGCPAKKVCRKLAGSALLSDEKLVRRILTAVVSSVSVPVTLKIRTGPDRENRNGVRIARIAEQEGIACLAVHGRTRADRFKGLAEYDTIAAIKQAVAIPVIANGDIDSPEKAVEVLQETGADGVMLGRAAQGNPFIFRQIREFRETGSYNAPATAEVHRVLMLHLRDMYELYGEYRAVRIARKHIGWYCAHQEKLSKAVTREETKWFREQANRVESASEQLALVDAYFSGA